jgi:hypothetical protein
MRQTPVFDGRAWWNFAGAHNGSCLASNEIGAKLAKLCNGGTRRLKFAPV